MSETQTQNETTPSGRNVRSSDLLCDEWHDIAEAPKDGSEIIGAYEDGEECSIVWSDNPVCMLGRRCGSFPPGWATSNNGDTDANLPMDVPLRWKYPAHNA